MTARDRARPGRDPGPLRIAYLHQYFQAPDEPGGTRAYEFGRRLAARGHEVHVLTSDCRAERAGRHWQVERLAGMHVHRLPVPYSNAMSYPRRIQSFARFAALAGPRAARLRPDVVLASSTPLTVAAPGLLAARWARARFVFEVRDLWPELPIEMGALRNPASRFLANRLARAAYRRAAAVIALSPGMAAGVIACGVPPGRVVVVPNAADLDLFAPRPAEVAAFRAERAWLGDRPLLVYAGTFGTVNGVDYLVRLAAQVRPLRPEVRFLLIGGGGHRDEVRDLARRLDLLDRTVFIADPVPRSQLPVVLGAASVASSVVIPVPGLAHNSANKFFDALAAGRPIMINHGGWQAELLQSTGAGLVLDPEDLTAAARLLTDRITDPGWLRTSGAAALRLARERFDRDRLFELFEAAVTGDGADPAPAVSRPPEVIDLRDPLAPSGTDHERGTRTSHGSA